MRLHFDRPRPRRGNPAAMLALAPNVAGALSYSLGFFTGAIFLLAGKHGFVRFHAYQSILVSVAWLGSWLAFTITSAVLSLVPVASVAIAMLIVLLSVGLALGGFALWLALIVKAYRGEHWKVPYLGDLAELYASGQAA